MDGRELSISDILNHPELSPKLKKMAEQSLDTKELATKVAREVKQQEAFDVRNVQDLRKILSKKEAKNLSTFVKDAGGIKLTPAERTRLIEAGVDVDGQPKLFREDGTQTLKESLATARREGFEVDEKIAQRFGAKKGTASQAEAQAILALSRDLAGDRIFTKKARAKIDEELGRIDEAKLTQADIDSTKSPIINRGNLQDYTNDYLAPENLRSFDQARQDEIATIKERPDELDINRIDEQVAEIEEATRLTQEDLGLETKGIDAVAEKINSQVKERSKAVDLLVNCILGGSE